MVPAGQFEVCTLSAGESPWDQRIGCGALTRTRRQWRTLPRQALGAAAA